MKFFEIFFNVLGGPKRPILAETRSLVISLLHPKSSEITSDFYILYIQSLSVSRGINAKQATPGPPTCPAANECRRRQNGTEATFVQ